LQNQLVYSRPRGDDASNYLHAPPPQVSRRRPPARQLLIERGRARVRARRPRRRHDPRDLARGGRQRGHPLQALRDEGAPDRGRRGERVRQGRQARRHPAGAARSLRADLESFARRYEELLVANLPLIRTMIGEIHRHADCERQALKGIFWPMRAALVERIRPRLQAGEARPGLNPAVAADLFAGIDLLLGPSQDHGHEARRVHLGRLPRGLRERLPGRDRGLTGRPGAETKSGPVRPFSGPVKTGAIPCGKRGKRTGT
jgi:hypothetical protein